MARKSNPVYDTPEARLDRWNQPTLEDLLAPLKDHQRRNFQRLMDFMDEAEGLHQRIVWYSIGWKWCIQYVLTDGKDKELDQFCYLVPDVEQPIICVPMVDDFRDGLPLRRLSKFVRDGVTSAKRAVKLSWATWTPGPESEANQLVDLIQRKYKFLTE